MLVSLGGVAMHIPTLTSCLNHFKNHHLQVEEDHDAYTTSMQQNVSHRPDGPPPSPKYVLILAQHVRDRRAPWRLNDVLAAHLFNHGIRLITLHDKIEHQRARAETRDLPFVPSSKFGRYRHDYEWLIPSLKFFSPSTLLTRSFQPFAYDELENYESAVSSQYSTDLQDILSALLSLWGSPPLPSFAADPEGLGYLLVHGIHRWPEDLARFIHIEPAPHDTPTTFYTRVFLHPLRFPALRALGLPDPDVNAIEQATRSALLAMPLLQALDYLHTQLLSGLCVAAPPRGLIPRDKMLDPMRRQPHPVACRLTRPREALQQVLSPTFRCWLGKRISPSMTLVTLKCDSVPWANYFTQGHLAMLATKHIKIQIQASTSFRNEENIDIKQATSKLIGRTRKLFALTLGHNTSSQTAGLGS